MTKRILLTAALAMLSIAAHAQKISELPAGTALGGTEMIPAVQSSATVRITPAQVKTYVIGAGSVSVASGKTLTASNTVTLTATDGSTLAIGAGGTLGSAAYTASSAYATAAQGATADAALAKASNLSDLTSASTARTNLGLATVAESGSASDLSSGTLPAARLPAHTGDATSSVGSAALTLATVNSNVGSFGSTTQCVTATANAKGLVTAISAATCAPAVGSVTGMGTGVNTALQANVGSAGAPVLFNGAGGTPSSLVGTNITGTASGLTAGNVTTNANLTGPITSSGNATAIASQTGTGTTFVMSAGPTITGTTIHNSDGAALAIRRSTAGATPGGLYIDFQQSTGTEQAYFGYGGATAIFQLYNGLNGAVQIYANALLRASFNSTGGLVLGASALTLTDGALGMNKITASGSAPGAAGLKLEVVCGTNAGSAKLIAIAGTSTTATTVLDNIGAGVTGC